MVAPTAQMLELEFTTKGDISNSLFQAFQTVIDGLPADVAASGGTQTSTAPVPASGPTEGSGFSTPGTPTPASTPAGTPTPSVAPPTEEQLAGPLTTFTDPGADSTAEPASAGAADPDSIDVVPNTVTRQVFKTRLTTLDNTTADVDRNGSLVTARVATILDMMERVNNGESTAFTLQELNKMLVTAFTDPEFSTKGDEEGDGNDLTTTNPVVDQDLLNRVPPGPNSDILKLFLEQNEQAVFQALINSFRARGVSGVFIRFLSNNFQTIWGMYLGELAQKAINGESIEDTRFVDWLQRFDTTGTFFSLSAFDRGDPSSRFASTITQSGVNR